MLGVHTQSYVHSLPYHSEWCRKPPAMNQNSRLMGNTSAKSQPRQMQHRSPQNVFQRLDARREAVRSSYLSKIRQARDEAQGLSREDQILRQQYIEARRRWEDDQSLLAAEALPQECGTLEEEAEKATLSEVLDITMQEDDMIDEILSSERNELLSLVSQASVDLPDFSESGHDHGLTSTHDVTMSDDDRDYDRLFMDIIMDESDQLNRARQDQTTISSQYMDMSTS